MVNDYNTKTWGCIHGLRINVNGRRQEGSIQDIQDMINFLSILACYVYQSCSGNDNSWQRFAEEKRLNNQDRIRFIFLKKKCSHSVLINFRIRHARTLTGARARITLRLIKFTFRYRKHSTLPSPGIVLGLADIKINLFIDLFDRSQL